MMTRLRKEMTVCLLWAIAFLPSLALLVWLGKTFEPRWGITAYVAVMGTALLIGACVLYPETRTDWPGYVVPSLAAAALSLGFRVELQQRLSDAGVVCVYVVALAILVGIGQIVLYWVRSRRNRWGRIPGIKPCKKSRRCVPRV